MITLHLNTEASVPASGFSFNNSLANLAAFWNLPMPSNSDCSYILEPQFAVDNFTTTAISSHCERERIELVHRLKSRKSWLCSSLAAIKESFECPVKLPESLLSRAVVEPIVELIRFALMLKPSRLIAIIPIDSFCFPTHRLSGKHFVVEPAMRLQSFCQQTLLGRICKQAIAKSFQHPLPALLVFNVFAYRVFADMANSSAVVRSGPHARNSRPEVLEPRSQNSRRSSLESIDDFSDTPSRPRFYEQMNVVRHDLHCMNLDIKFSRHFQKRLAQPCFHFPD